MAAGFAASIVAHEAAHLAASFALGADPHIGFDKYRPTIFSGIDINSEPRKQFIFSAAGLVAQDLMNELVLDIPHSRGGALERGFLAGGVATTLFYITIGRNARVSDITVMSRTSSLSRTQLSLIFGGISAVQSIRIWRDSHYTHFFVAPTGAGAVAGLRLSVS